MIAPSADPVELRRALVLIFSLHRVVEIRALRVDRGFGRPVNMGGFFDNIEDAFKAIMALPKCKAIYWTLNRIPDDLLAIRANRMDVAEENGLTKDCHISRRVLLLVDCDPVRSHPDISATAAEHFAAQELATTIMATLADDYSWPYGIMFDSGNGFGIWYRIDLPADDNGLVSRVLKALDARFSTVAVAIDTAVANAARITKLPGTVARKGDHIQVRPHRVARIISQVDSFDEVDIISAKMLTEFADAFAPATTPPATTTPRKPTPRTRPGAASALDRCIGYLRKIPDSVAGQHGSNRLYHAAALTVHFDLSESDALQALSMFNAEKCQPPWDEREIHRKLADAVKAVDAAGDRGSMLTAKESPKARRIEDAMRFALEESNV